MNNTQAFLIVGLGLMGGSYAMGLSKNGYAVYAIDQNPASIEWATQHKLIAKGAATSDTEACHTLIAQADYIVLALYPDDIYGWLKQNQAYFKPSALLTDLAGVKASFVPQVQQLLADKFEFIPSHPMAGREVSGVQNATDSMFFGANFLITPTNRNTPAGIAFATQLAQTLGFGRITTLTIEQHDQMIGYVSQLTHAIAVSLMNANTDPMLSAVTGDSFRDLTRIADINDELWSELFLQNAPALTAEIDQFTDCLQDLKEKVATGDKEGLRALFKQSSIRRRQFNKQQ